VARSSLAFKARQNGNLRLGVRGGAIRNELMSRSEDPRWRNRWRGRLAEGGPSRPACRPWPQWSGGQGRRGKERVRARSRPGQNWGHRGMGEQTRRQTGVRAQPLTGQQRCKADTDTTPADQMAPAPPRDDNRQGGKAAATQPAPHATAREVNCNSATVRGGKDGTDATRTDRASQPRCVMTTRGDRARDNSGKVRTRARNLKHR
jgi:hypothetical protein